MKNRPIIIRKYKKPHIRLNTGAWKIAYADFVTAMMALFLLMWLVNVATEETKKESLNILQQV
jgi:chemotaxis protein MotB